LQDINLKQGKKVIFEVPHSSFEKKTSPKNPFCVIATTEALNNFDIESSFLLQALIVPDHVGGRPRNIKAWFL
jgi:hypothetical protein